MRSMTLSWDSWRHVSAMKRGKRWVRTGCTNPHSISTHSHEWLRLAADDILVYRELLVAAKNLEVGKLAGLQ